MFVLRHIIKTIAYHWKRFVLFLVLSALLCAATGLLGVYLLYGDGVIDPVTLVIVDEDNSPESRLFYSVLTGGDFFDDFIRLRQANAAEAVELLRTGEATAVATLPPGFADSIITGENLPFGVVYNQATPLKSELVRSFADAFTGMLKTSQMGVYTALSYTREHGTDEDYQRMLWNSNMDYLQRVGDRLSLFAVEELSSTGDTGVFRYYLTHAVAFLLLLSPMLLLDLLRPLLSLFVAGTLSRLGRGRWQLVLGCWAGVFLVYLLPGLGLSMVLAARGIFLPSLPFWMYLVVLLAGISAMTVLLSLLLRGAGSSVLLSLLAVACLLLAGGVLPSEYLHPVIFRVGGCTPQFWAARLMRSGLAGDGDGWAVLTAISFAAVCLLACVLLLRRRERRGER